LFVVLGVGLVARLAWGLSRPADEASLRQLPDQSEYLSLARSLLAGTGLRFYDERFGQSVFAYRMPGYPAFLAACGGDAVVARVVQAVVDTSTALAAALLATMLSPARSAGPAAVLAAALVAANPFLIFFSGLLLSETLFAALLAWGMVLLLAGARGGRASGEPADADSVEPAASSPPAYRPRTGTFLWLAGGLTIAASAWVRPSAPPLTVLLGVLASFAARPADRAVPPFRPLWPLPVATTMLVLAAAVLAPWAYRNSLVLPAGEAGQPAWVWTTTNGGVTAYDGFNPDASGASDQSVLKSLPQLRTMNEVERSDYLAARAARFVRENPWRAGELALVKAARTWSPVPLSDEYGSWMHRLVGLAYSVPLDALVLLGLWRSRMRLAGKAFLLAPAAYFTVVHMASVGSLRYRVPVEPPLAVLAAAGACTLAARSPVWRRAGSTVS
jgi:hypothetical protein